MRFWIGHRKRIRLFGGLITINLSQGRWTSTTYRLGPFSRNSRREGTRVDLPGGFHGGWRR
jgi:hypothetical protein